MTRLTDQDKARLGVGRFAAHDNQCATCGHQFVEHRISLDGFRCTRCKCVKRHWRARK
jgi:ribosomal protein L32